MGTTHPIYYDLSNYANSILALEMSIYSYLSKKLFYKNGVYEKNRIIYSTTAYALRKRASGEEVNVENSEYITNYNNTNDLRLPFANFKISNIVPKGDRSWFNTRNVEAGLYIEEISKKVKTIPITITYDSSYFCKKNIELNYAYTRLIMDNITETMLNYSVSINNLDVQIPAIINFNGLQYNPTYTEQDWLNQNKINSMAMGFEILTFFVENNSEAIVSIPETLILKFQTLNSLDQLEYEETIEKANDFFS